MRGGESRAAGGSCIVYMGTPDFAVPPLLAMAESGYRPRLVVTQPDKARDRGKKVQPTPVKKASEACGIEVVQPEKIKNNEAFFDRLRELDPDLIVVAAYGKILPAELLKIPKRGCVNIHASLLPRFRGAAPIQRSIIEGDERTGITLMYMEEGLDTGDMIARASTEIGRKDADALHDELSQMGARLLIEYLPKILSGDVDAEKQDDALSCYAPMLTKEEGRADFSKSAVELERLVRGMGSWPGVTADYEGKSMKIRAADVAEGGSESAPGTILSAGKEGIRVACGEGILLITQLQMPGKKAMSAADYLRGNRIEAGSVLK